MGVYVFRSLHAPLIKVGHYAGGDAWGRVAKRGFHSCVCPRVLGGRVDACDLELLAWFPALGTKHEHAAHRALGALHQPEDQCAGEWHAARLLDAALSELSRHPGAVDEAHGCSLERALEVRRQKRERRVKAVKAVQSWPSANQLGAKGSVKAVQGWPKANQLGAFGSVKAVQSWPKANQLGAKGSVKAVQSRPLADQLGAFGSVKAVKPVKKGTVEEAKSKPKPHQIVTEESE